MPAAASDPGPDWFTLAMGNDNPHFDLRQHGDPGGVGFYRVNTQLQLFETDRTACSFGLQAVAPLGQEFDGLPENLGPTVVTPALSLFHALDAGLAVQAFVGKNVPLANGATRPLRRHIQCGVAVQQALSTEECDPLSSLHLSLGALGQMGPDPDRLGRPPGWEVLPGLHWKPSDAWWLSAGLVLPLGSPRPETGQTWQVTGGLQF